MGRSRRPAAKRRKLTSSVGEMRVAITNRFDTYENPIWRKVDFFTGEWFRQRMYLTCKDKPHHIA